MDLSNLPAPDAVRLGISKVDLSNLPPTARGDGPGRESHVIERWARYSGLVVGVLGWLVGILVLRGRYDDMQPDDLPGLARAGDLFLIAVPATVIGAFCGLVVGGAVAHRRGVSIGFVRWTAMIVGGTVVGALSVVITFPALILGPGMVLATATLPAFGVALGARIGFDVKGAWHRP